MMGKDRPLLINEALQKFVIEELHFREHPKEGECYTKTIPEYLTKKEIEALGKEYQRPNERVDETIELYRLSREHIFGSLSARVENYKEKITTNYNEEEIISNIEKFPDFARFLEFREKLCGVTKVVLDYVLDHPGCSTDDIIENIDVPPELVNKALQTLSEEGEIEQAIITKE